MRHKFCMNWAIVVLVSAILLIVGEPRAATITFFSDESTWASQSGAPILNFEFTADNVALANEVSSPPAIGALLGPQLTFQSANTGLPFNFTFKDESPDPGTQVIFSDQTIGLGSTPTTHHDWSVGFGSGSAVF